MKKPMQKIRTCLQKTPNALLCALGAVVFLAGFYFLCYRTPLNEVWLPTTMNNDEALYNRQVVSVLTHGGPQGYFGYQESTADICRYGTWGPLLIWAYALPGLLFGASVNVVLWCNLLLIAVGIAVFARCARLNYWQCIALCGALFSIMLPLRSCVSGASEAMHYMLALLIVGTAAALHRSGKTGWLIACAAACAVETIFRPYALLFWVFPLTAVWQNKRRRAACLGTAAGGFAVSLFAMAKLAAPYFSDGGMDFDGIRLLLQLHPVAAVRYECARAAALLHAAWRDDILPTLHGETTYIGGGCVTFLAVVLVAVVCLVWDKHKGRPLVLKGCALFCSAVIALVLLFMYNIDPRHMMLLAILLLGAVVVEDAAPAAVWLPVLVVLLLPMNFQRGSLPEKNAEMAAQMQTVEAALTASVQDAGADPWDHTLAYAYDDGVFHGYLYYELTRYNAAVELTSEIMDAYPQYSYTIISTTEELYQSVDDARHEEILDFYNKSRLVDYYIPTEYLFFYIEKNPIYYAQYHFFSGPRWLAQDKYTKYYEYSTAVLSIGDGIEHSEISEEAVGKSLLTTSKASDAYSVIINRTILESEMYHWCQEFKTRLPNEIKVYYEDENFICYVVKQNPAHLYNLNLEK